MSSAAPTAGYVRTFNRFESKYLLGDEQARAMIRDLEPYTRADAHSDGERGYPIQSLYWDSPDLVFFWEKVDGQKYRRKLRFRRYGDSDGVFVEIKQRIDQTVQKRRALLTGAEHTALFGSGRIDPQAEYGARDPVLQEALFLCRHYSLEPKLSIAYRRLALVARYEHDLRITFDTRLMYDSRDLDSLAPFENGKYFLPPNVCVLELKYNERVPLWLIKLVQHHGAFSRRFSKYCRAADLEFFQGRFTPDP